MKNIDVIRTEIDTAMKSSEGIRELGKRLVDKHPEYREHLRFGTSAEQIGQSHLEEQIRIYLIYKPDRTYWRRLLSLSEAYSHQDTDAMSIFSEWDYIHDDLKENIGDAYGWTGTTQKNPDLTTFVQRVEMVTCTLQAFTPQQLRNLEENLSREEGAAPTKSAGCYVATAVYGSYEAPEVLVLRNWRDASLNSSAIGKKFIRFYYAVSPTLVQAVGASNWFTIPSRIALNKLVRHLEAKGYASTPISVTKLH